MSKIKLALFVVLYAAGALFVTTAPTVAFAAAMFGFCTLVVLADRVLDRVERDGAAATAAAHAHVTTDDAAEAAMWAHAYTVQ